MEDSAVSSNRGGGISNSGTLSVRRTTFSANSGGGISNFADATVTESTFSRNRASGNGGAIFNALAELTVEGSTFSGNSAGQGGAIVGNKGTVTVEDSTFVANTAREFGGGVSSIDSQVEIVGSTFWANIARGAGGGVSSVQSSVRISNSTFSRNEASRGGGVHNSSPGSSVGDVFVEFSTFANNEATERGGGLFNQSSNDPRLDPTIYPRATIVSGNEAPEGPDAFGPFDSRGYNLIGNTAGSSGFGGTDLTDTSPRLDPRGLRDNGGPTRTIALTAGSPAVDAVAEGCPPPDTDQGGVRRPQNGDGEGQVLCDIGAFERSTPSP